MVCGLMGSAPTGEVADRLTTVSPAALSETQCLQWSVAVWKASAEREIEVDPLGELLAPDAQERTLRLDQLGLELKMLRRSIWSDNASGPA